MIDARILPALHARLAAAFAPPSVPLVRFEVDAARVGELTPGRARRVAAFVDVLDVDRFRVTFARDCASADARTEGMDRVARALAAEGALSAWRDERYDVRAGEAGAPLFRLERAAARYFGIRTQAVHVNGLVDQDGGAATWIARRSATKAIDPGLLDNLVGGGIAAGATAGQTLIKEAWEEAGIDAATASRAQPVGMLRIRRLQPDGLQHETIHVHDLWLPREFVPRNQDGEAIEHRLVPLAALPAQLAQDTGHDALTADASLVALDALIRLGVIDADDALYPWFAALCGEGR
ncbi:hypothetical protein BURK1_00964 [Burkholderiales bacterium]|nr:hypothetical protein BURK1_00964 [Burkholderiales bacterium]